MEKQVNLIGWPDNIIRNFWNKVNYPGNDQECWEWTAGKGSNGKVYGTFTIKSSKYHQTFRAHRFAWEFYYGSIPPGQQVLHKCDNPPCCNPEHLMLGTPHDNMQDRMIKNRQNSVRGENVGTSKLSEIDVVEMLEAIENDEVTNIKDLCIVTGAQPENIRRILSGEIWTHVTEKYSESELKLLKSKIFGSYTIRLTETDVLQIKRDLLANIPPKTLAYRHKVTIVCIYDIKNGKTWSNVK